MNKKLIADRFAKAVPTYPHEASIQHLIAIKMIRLLSHHLGMTNSSIIEFGCGTGNFSRLLFRTLHPTSLLLNDLCPEMQFACRDLLQEEEVSFRAGDAETELFDHQTGTDSSALYNLITSCSTLQWFESPTRFFQQCHMHLEDKGYFAFSTFGKENMQEICHLTGNGLPYLSRQELENALSPHFDIVHSEEETIPMHFDSPMNVLYHLRKTGVTGLSSHKWTRKNLVHFCQRYKSEFAHGHAVSLTYHPIYMIAQKK